MSQSKFDKPMEMDNSDDSNKRIPIVSQWLSKYKLNKLRAIDFHSYWEDVVPRIFTPDKIIRDDSRKLTKIIKKKKQLLTSLEQFICGQKNVKLFYDLRQQNRSICGKIFNLGETIYSCQECEMDDSCALCVECFNKSAHKNHRYKIVQAFEGGSCDCGDIEAWKNEAHCEIHRLDLEKKHVNLLNTDIEERAYLAFEYILLYAFEVLFQHSTLMDENKNNIYVLMIENNSGVPGETVQTLCDSIEGFSNHKHISIVTYILQDSRQIVAWGSLDLCKSLLVNSSPDIDTDALDVCIKQTIVTSHSLAHQTHALIMIGWMLNILEYSEHLRTVFSKVVLAPKNSNGCILKYIIENDFKMWKSARLECHKLFNAGMLTDFERKKEFSILFTDSYDVIMKNLVDNDYDYSYSIASFSVQIFTSPRISNYLLAHHDVLHKVLSTFLSLCAPIVNEKNKLLISENVTDNWPYKKATYVFDDIRRLLDCVLKATAWNTNLRKLFCRALPSFINILGWAENTTILYDREATKLQNNSYELALQFHSKLTPITEKILLLCESDRILLKYLYKIALKQIVNILIDENLHRPTEVKQIMTFKANCIIYDVSIEPISIHFPLTRFFAALSLCMDNYGVCFAHRKLRSTKQSIVQIIERVLRVLVFMAQLNAGMWSPIETILQVQMDLYASDLNYRPGMFDKDIVILQIGASLIDSNEFLIHLLNKFNLLTWADPAESLDLNRTNEDLEQLYILVKEFLTLVVVIVGERFTPKVGQVTYHDCIKKEVIQQLCISSMSHSQLKRALKHIKNDTCLDKAINEVAVVITNEGKCIYKLKPIYYNDYNVFYYHYSQEQINLSENNQIKLRKETGELQCCPPPSLPLFSKSFENITNLMQCTLMFKIIKSILVKPLEYSNQPFGFDIHLILHLIGYALHEEEKQCVSSFSFTKRSKCFGIEEALIELQHNPAAIDYQDIIVWTINKFKQVSALKSEDDKDVVNFVSTIELKQQRSKLITEKKAAIITQMTQMQNNFIKNNALLFENVTPNLNNNVTENIEDFSIAVGPYKTTSMTCGNMYTCILCQEEELVTYQSNKPMILAALVQNSSVLCQVSQSNICDQYFSEQYYIPANLGPSPHISTCGHVMHIICWQNFLVKADACKTALSTLRISYLKREYLCPLCESICNTGIPLLPSISSFTKLDVKKTFDKNTFDWLKELKNALNQINVEHSNLIPNHSLPLKSTMQIIHFLLENNSLKLVETEVPESLQFSINSDGFNMSLPTPPLGAPEFPVNANEVPPISTILAKVILKFTETVYSKATFVSQPHSNNNQIPLMVWKACAYTIHSIEVVLRYTNKPLLDLSFLQKGSLEALIRVSGILSSTRNNCEINLHAFRLLSIAINNGGNNSIGILDWDAFGMLVSLTMTMPSLYYTDDHYPTARGTILDLHILSLMFITNIVQIILTMNIKEDPEEILEITAKEAEDTRCIADLVYKLRGIRVKNTIAIWNLIQSCTIPFLRCCSLFYHFLTEVPASAVLMKDNGDTYYNMCCYLGLPTSCKELLDKPYVDMLIDKWTENEKLIKIKLGGKIKFRVWNHINELVKLPNDYTELINIASMSKCNIDYDDISRNPTMCLVCGTIFCSHITCSLSEVDNVSNHFLTFITD